MYSRFVVLSVFAGVMAGVSQSAMARETLTKFDLSALPNKCIALRQGRTCFAQVTLRFSVLKPGRYCIKQHGMTDPLYCESIQRYGLFNVEFQSKSKMAYTLIDQITQQELASTTVDVAWVHQKTSRKRRWRIF